MGHVAVQERRIVVAVDETDESLHALSWSLDYIKTTLNTQIALTLLHVKRPTVVTPLKLRQSSADIHSHDVLFSQDWRDDQMADWVIEKAKKICEGYDVKVDAKVEEGDPTDMICQTVDTLSPDMLVMGSHGYGPTARALMGSVSSECVQKAACPVVVVKMPKA